MTDKQPAGALRQKGSTGEAKREAARLLGMSTSERKKATSAANGRLSKSGGRPPLPLSEIPCNCGRGEAMEGHPTTCPRGRAIRRRQKAGQL